MAATTLAGVILGQTPLSSRVARSKYRTITSCMVKPSQVAARKCAPFLERQVVGSQGAHEWRAVPDLWRSSAEKYGERIALVDPHHEPPCQMTYKQVEKSILNFAEALRILGILPNQHVALFADNSCRWLIADQGIMAMGAANAVRGSRSSQEELVYILNHSDSVALVIDGPELLKKLAPGLKDSPRLKFIILLWGEKRAVTDPVNIPIHTYEECVSLGQKSRKELAATNDTDAQCEVIQPDDVATVVYTSGTTGNPKGVMLTHTNLLHQVEHLVQAVLPDPGDRFLSLLPPWHMYERAAEYFIFTRGIELVYTNVKCLKEDLQAYPAQYLVSVPLVFETLCSGVQKQILKASRARRAFVMGLMSVSLQYMEFRRIYQGKALTRAKKAQNTVIAAMELFLAWVIATMLFPLHFLGQKLVYGKIRTAIGITKSGISGGGSLPSHVDKFFEVIGITLLNGYGLTEASPVVASRALPDNVLGTVGRALPRTQVKVVELEGRKELEPGVRGLVMVRGPQVMKGYYKNPRATSEAIDKEGWLDTGDVGWLVPECKIGGARRCGGMLVLEGRAKDTIVLSTGENVEPAEIEEAALQSGVIDQIMVVGQDQRRIGALIVPNKEEADKIGTELKSLIRQELNKHLSGCSFQIGPFVLVAEPFSIDNGLMTPTMKLRRDAIFARYKDEVATMFQKHK